MHYEPKLQVPLMKDRKSELRKALKIAENVNKRKTEEVVSIYKRQKPVNRREVYRLHKKDTLRTTFQTLFLDKGFVIKTDDVKTTLY